MEKSETFTVKSRYTHLVHVYVRPEYGQRTLEQPVLLYT